MSKVSMVEFADSINDLMYQISREYHKHASPEFYKIKLTLPQFMILDILNRRGESNMTDIANVMNVTTAAVTGLVDRLVRDGYAKRTHGLKDRRIIKVSLTGKGSKMVAAVNEHRRRMTIKIFSMISEEERKRYIDILAHICKHITEQEER